MQTKIYTNYETLSAAVAQIMFDTIQQKTNAVICLASGHTPLLPCQLFVQKANDEHLHISETTYWFGRMGRCAAGERRQLSLFFIQHYF